MLSDALVGGNCAIRASAAGLPAAALSALSPGSVLVSRSGKQPAARLGPADFVALQAFDVATWQATFLSAEQCAAPSSDAPLLHAALAAGAAQRYGWGADGNGVGECTAASAPAVALHGHALAEGAGVCMCACACAFAMCLCVCVRTRVAWGQHTCVVLHVICAG